MKLKLLLILFFVSLGLCQAQLDEQWCYRDSIPGIDVKPINKIITDTSGNSYITGYEYSLRSIFVKKIDSSGVLKWTKFYTDSNSIWSVSMAPRIMFFSKSGHIKIIGENTYAIHLFLNEYDTSGNLLYTQMLTDSAVNSNPHAVFAVADSSENIYLGFYNSYTTGPGTPGSYLKIKKYTSIGIEILGYNGSFVQGTQNEMQSITLDANRNITVLHYSSGADISRLNSSGTSVYHINSPNAGQTQGILQNDKSSNIIYCDKGYDEGIAGSVFKLDTMLATIWSYSFPLRFYTDIVQDTSGNIYTCGQQAGYLIVQKLNSSGALQWLYQFTISNHTTEIGTKIKIAPDGSLYIQGSKKYAGISNYYESAIMLHLDTNGNYISSALHSELNSTYTYPFDFDFDSLANIYVCGVGRHGQSDYPFVYKLCNNFCNGNITGKRYSDSNTNCIYDSTEVILPSQVLLLKPNNIYATTNAAGYYHFKADSGIYVIKPILPLYWNTTCNKDSAIVTINNANPGDTIDFGSLGSGTLNVNDLQVSYSMTNIVRPGFKQNSSINYYNVGTTVFSNVLLKLAIDPAVFNLVSAVPLSDSVSGSNYFWHISSLGIYASGNVQIQTTVPATVPLMTHFINSVLISPYLTDTTRFNNCDSIKGEVRGSCDPNLKTISNTLFNSQSPLTPADNELAYHIDFQNTGTDTAFNILVIDTIDSNLDIASLRFGASSNNYFWEIYGTGIIKFTFSNILLPDSNTNESKSHGYVKYYIRPKSSLASITRIANTANIFFDFNANVRTNSVYYPPFSTQVNNLNGPLSTALNLFPNPANKMLQINCRKLISKVKVFDISGNLITEEQLFAEQSITILWLTPGIYFIELTSNDEIFHSKFVKQ